MLIGGKEMLTGWKQMLIGWKEVLICGKQMLICRKQTAAVRIQLQHEQFRCSYCGFDELEQVNSRAFEQYMEESGKELETS